MIYIIKNKKLFLINTLTTIVIILLIFFFVKYIFLNILPFIFGFLIANLMFPIINKLHTKTKLNIKLCSFLTISCFYLLIILIIVSIVFLSINQIKILSQNINIQIVNINTIYTDLQNKFGVFYEFLKDYGFLTEDTFNEIMTNISSFFINLMTNISVSIPKVIFNVFLTFFTSFLFLFEYDKLLKNFKKITNTKQFNFTKNLKIYTFKNIKNLIKAQLILMLYTFCFLTISFLIIKIPFFLIISIVISFFDFLPLIGTSMFFIPWILFESINGNTDLAVKLLIIFFLMNFIRNIIEPHIIGKQTSLSPILSLFSIFIGTKLFGVIGFFISPLLSLILIDFIKENTKKKGI